MDSVEQEKAALIQDIEADARREAEGIVQEASTRATEKREYARRQAESILDEAHRRAQEQTDAIREKAVRSAEREARRRAMQQRAALAQQVMERVEKRLATMTDAPEYRDALTNWIAEAGIGLAVDAAEVNASERERAMIDDHMLAEASEKVHAATGRRIALTLSGDPPLSAQGVVLTAADGRTAFNNQVKTRILRNERRIHTLIYDTLFGDDREG
jgi:vacuolar-type H+-ATPase subunit E/Vma4